MSVIRVIVNGAKGRMGSESVRAVQGAEDMALAAQTDLGDDLGAAIQEHRAQVAVDFTTPKVAIDMIRVIIDSGAGGVIGTTGFTPVQIMELQELCAGRKPAVLIAPNFSIGAVLLMKLSEMVAPHMPQAEIIELHHDKKADSPSGTAIKTAEMIEAARRNAGVKANPIHAGDAPRGQLFENTPVHSVRLPGLLAHQEVIFGGPGQTLTLRHDSLDRSSFMPGVLLGIRAVMEREGLIYGLDHILFGMNPSRPNS